MNDVVTKSASSADMIIMSAAVTDFAPANVSEEKERKASFGSHVDVTPTVDIAATLGEQRTANQTLVGFAAETENPVSKARAKLEEKNLDWIVANDIAASDTGFAHDENRAVLVSRDDEIEFPKMLKVELAACLLETLLTP